MADAPIFVVGAVLRSHDRCLAAQRGPQMRHPLAWEFPGGKVEAHETPEEALKRELREELGIGARIGGHIARSEMELGGRRICLDLYEAESDDAPTALEHHRVPRFARHAGTSLGPVLLGPASLEHAALRWVSAEELPDLAWAPADVPILEQVAQWLRASSLYDGSRAALPSDPGAEGA